MKMTKDARELIRSEYAKVWASDSRMVDYCAKSTSGFADFGDVIITCDKPEIQKHFWFGEHNYEDKSAECRAASESVEYFLRENMDRCEAANVLERLDSSDASDAAHYERYRFPVAVKKAYCSQPDDCKLGYLGWRDVTGEFRDGREPEHDYRPLTDSEIEELREFLRDEVEKFEKRLKTYLKRYGLTKCEYGTYWADR